MAPYRIRGAINKSFQKFERSSGVVEITELEVVQSKVSKFAEWS